MPDHFASSSFYDESDVYCEFLSCSVSGTFCVLAGAIYVHVHWLASRCPFCVCVYLSIQKAIRLHIHCVLSSVLDLSISCDLCDAVSTTRFCIDYIGLRESPQNLGCQIGSKQLRFRFIIGLFVLRSTNKDGKTGRNNKRKGFRKD